MPRGQLPRDPVTNQFLKTHGEGMRTPEYRAWFAMKKRCYFGREPKVVELYQNRGIKVCDRWLNSYENFLADVGRRPSTKHSLDRIDNNGNYEPGNVRWATWTEQAANRRTKRAYWQYRPQGGHDDYVLYMPKLAADW